MVSHKIQVWHTLEGTSRTVSTAHKGTSTLAERVRTEKNVGDTLKKSLSLAIAMAKAAAWKRGILIRVFMF